MGWQHKAQITSASQVCHTLVINAVQAKPPKPDDSSIFFTAVPEVTLYVAQHGGMIGNDKVIAAKVTELLSKLKDDGQSIDDSLILTADYDPPYRLQHRHNEIWVAAAQANILHSTS